MAGSHLFKLFEKCQTAPPNHGASKPKPEPMGDNRQARRAKGKNKTK